jgi:hypothetical protein
MSVTVVVVQVKTLGAAILTLGGVAVCETVADVEAVQPFEGSVAVTLYVPADVTTKVFKVLPSLQTKSVKIGVDDAESVTLGVVQLSVAGGAIATLGGILFCVTVVAALAVQPLLGSVAVTVYVPGALTFFVFPVPPPLHAKVAPTVVEVADKIALVIRQFKVVVAGMFTLGAFVFCVTVVDVDAVHPPGSVAVTV